MRGIETLMREGEQPSIHLKLRPDDMLRPCPFCGSRDLDFWNTHTACYTVECRDCGAQVSGLASGSHLPSHRLTLRHHQTARRSALAAWNRRTR